MKNTMGNFCLFLFTIEAYAYSERSEDLKFRNQFRHSRLNCSTEESTRLSVAFLHANKMHDFSSCPHETWLEAMQEMDIEENRINGVYVNIGFNKGYNFANWMSLFVPWSPMTPNKWGDALVTFLDPTKQDLCGFCGDCTSNFHKTVRNDSRKGEQIFIGVDINKYNINVVSRVLNCSHSEECVIQTPNGSLSVFLIQAAGGEYDGIIQVPKFETSDETIHLPDPKTGFYSSGSKVDSSTVLESIPTVSVSQLLHNISSTYRDASDLLSSIYNTTYSHMDHHHNNHNHNNNHDHTTSLHLLLSTFLTAVNLTHLLPSFQRERLSLNDLHHLEPAYLKHIGLSNDEVLAIKAALIQTEENGNDENTANSRKKNRHFERIVIDILLIDTEGHDALVVNGAKYLLLKKAIRSIMFEYHSLSPWAEMKLEDTVHMLDLLGMDCFFQGTGRLWPVTGSCWHDSYEFHSWSNVLCVLRDDPWYQAITPYILVPASTLLPEGSLIRFSDSPAVYRIDGRLKRQFRNGKVFMSMGFSFDDVVVVDKLYFYLIPDGPEY